MKKTFLLLVALVATVVGANAQGQTATLQQGDKMTPFYGPDAFVQAYNAAQKGAVITLSAGTFNTVDSVMKEVKIIGNGYKENKTVIKERFYDQYIRNDKKLPISLIIRANNVLLEGLDMNCVMIRNSNHLTVRHCKIYNLWGVTTKAVSSGSTSTIPFPSQHKNTIVDQCVIGVDLATSGENYCIKNSFVTGFNWSNTQEATNTLISNCISIYANANAVYKNCLIGLPEALKNGVIINGSSRCEYYNNVFFGSIIWNNDYGKVDGRYNIVLSLDSDTKWMTPERDGEDSQTCKGNIVASYDAVFGESDEENPLFAPIITTAKGDDGTAVGPYGGTGFTENPHRVLASGMV